MKDVKLLFILLICLQLIKIPVYGQEPNITQEPTIIGLEILKSDNQLIRKIRENGFVIKPIENKQIYT
ncbi:MAG: hypothetical protein FD167_1355, partial [bacterium]